VAQKAVSQKGVIMLLSATIGASCTVHVLLQQTSEP